MATTTKLSALDGDELLDRAEQLTELARCWQAVRDDTGGRLVLASGEAGAGKTALLRRFWAGLEPATLALWAACDPLSTARPLGPLLDIGRATEGALKERLENGAQPYDVADALIAELESGISPALLVVEDMHWADDATLDVVRIVARRIEQLPALMLVSFREEELGRFHPLRALSGELAAPGHVARIDVPPLGRAAVASLAADSRLDAGELYGRTGGNAFFVTEALAAGTDGLPGTVRDAVLARAARLGPESRTLLDAAAIAPRGAEPWLLEALVETVSGALEGCVSAGMLAFERDRVAFRHEIARLAVEESIMPDVRLLLHRRALAALVDPPGGARDLAQLAYHAEAAADTAAVLEFAPAAAEEAAALGAHSEAQAQFGRALRFAGAVEPPRRAELLERFADEGYLTDMREGALEAVSEAIAIREAAGDAIGHGRDLRKRAALLSCVGRVAESLADSETAVQVLERVPPGPDLAAACGGLSYSYQSEARMEEARRVGERGVALAEAAGDGEALRSALCNFGTTRLFAGEEAGRAMLERTLALALEADDGPTAGVVYINLVCGLGMWRKWFDADPYLREGLVYCRARGLDAWEQCLLANAVDGALSKGEWDEAADTASAVLAGSPEWHVEPRTAAAWGLGLVQARRGDPSCWRALDEALDAARPTGDLAVIGQVAIARAEARWLEGDGAGVAAETDEVFEQALSRNRHPYAGALACWRRRAGLSFEVPSGGLEQHRLQLQGEWGRAAAMWREADCPYDAALALLDSDDVRAWHESLDALTELGARPVAAIVSRRLREAGERSVRRGPRPQTMENPLGLTGRQLEVLALLAQGMRNGEIADRLVVSRKTVEHHVSAILGKLGVRGRGEATAKAIKLGIVAAPGEDTLAS